MKKLLFIVLFLSGCSSKFNIEIFNNSSFPLIIYGDNSVTIDPNESKKIGFFTTTRIVTAESNGQLYTYGINVSQIPSEYVVSGWRHGIKLQVEPNLDVYIRKPEFNFLSLVSVLHDEQPVGFPLVAVKVDAK